MGIDDDVQGGNASVDEGMLAGLSFVKEIADVTPVKVVVTLVDAISLNFSSGILDFSFCADCFIFSSSDTKGCGSVGSSMGGSVATEADAKTVGSGAFLLTVEISLTLAAGLLILSCVEEEKEA